MQNLGARVIAIAVKPLTDPYIFDFLSFKSIQFKTNIIVIKNIEPFNPLVIVLDATLGFKACKLVII